MAQQTVNIGTAANDGSGDSLRAGGNKINANFTELYNTLINNPALLMPLVAAALDTLPTTEPATAGQWWLNGGIPSKT